MLGRFVEADNEKEHSDRSKQRLDAKTEAKGNREDSVSASLYLLVMCSEVGFDTELGSGRSPSAHRKIDMMGARRSPATMNCPDALVPSTLS